MAPRYQQGMLFSGIAASVRHRAQSDKDDIWEDEARKVSEPPCEFLKKSQVATLEYGFDRDAFEDSDKGETDEETEETGEFDESCDEAAQLEDADGDLSETSESEAWFSDSQSSASRTSKCSLGMESMDSMVDHFDREQTIIIFDWDDTLCPTTILNEEVSRLASDEEEEVLDDAPPVDAALQELVIEARKTLERARELAAEVVIVTNATEGWVESSCETWLPGFRSSVDQVQIKSARSTWEPLGVATPTGWKAAEFEDVIKKFYSRYWRQSWKNIIVIGDACYEHEALAQVAKNAPQGHAKSCRAKSIKFATQPSVELLTRELYMLRESFRDIVHHDGNLEFSFYNESL